MAEIYRLYTQADYDSTTKVTGAGQAVEYSHASSLAGTPGDVLYTMVNTNSNYLSASIPQQTERIRSRFHINPSNLTFGATEQFNVTYFRGTSFTNRTHRMYIGTSSGNFFIVPLSYAEGNTSPVSDFVAVDKQEMWIEDEFVRSSGLGVTDAQYTVWHNGVQVYQRTGFANYDSFALVNQCWFGGVAEMDAGTSGTFTFGKFLVTNNVAPIGPYVPPGGGPYLVHTLRRRRRLHNSQKG